MRTDATYKKAALLSRHTIKATTEAFTISEHICINIKGQPQGHFLGIYTEQILIAVVIRFGCTYESLALIVHVKRRSSCFPQYWYQTLFSVASNSCATMQFTDDSVHKATTCLNVAMNADTDVQMA